MSLTLTTIKEPGLFKDFSVTEVTFDSSYLEGGEAFTPSQAGLQTIDHSFVEIVAGSESATLRPSNAFYKGEKLHLIDSATGKEIASTSDMSKVKVQVWAFGKARAR